MTQVIGKKLRLMNVPVATEEEQVQQLVITAQGKVKKSAKTNNFLFVFMLGNFNADGHIHTLGITTQEFEYLVQSFRNNITKQTSQEAGHAHDVRFGFSPAANSFNVFSITPAGDVEHSEQLIAINTPNQPSGMTVSLEVAGVFLEFVNGLLIGANGG